MSAHRNARHRARRQSAPSPRAGHGWHHAFAVAPAALLLTFANAPWGGAAAPTSEPVAADPEAEQTPTAAVPTKSLEAPASVRRGLVAARARDGIGDRTVASASAAGIPDAALSAYQRAQTVINAADKSCRVSWQLIAAIGRVESDHGRVHGGSLTDKGVATPAIYGIALDGRNGTASIPDTDAGQYDSDDRWDRAVGPMQFIPSTWSVVGVDGDNDGKRDPQDVDDAALATAVYLCSGNDDLTREVDRRSAIFRYNHSHDYVDLVLAYMAAYEKGDFTAVPNASTGYGGSLAPTTEAVRAARRDADRARARGREEQPGKNDEKDGNDKPRGEVRPPKGDDKPGGQQGNDSGQGPDDEGTGGVVEPPTGEPTDPTEEPTEEPTDPTEEPTEEPTDPAEEPSEEPTDPVEEPALTEEEATTECLTLVGATAADLPDLEALGLLADYTLCMEELGHPQ